MTKKTNYFLALTVFTLIGIIYMLMRDFPQGSIRIGWGPSFYPSLLLIILGGLTLILLAQTFLSKEEQNGGTCKKISGKELSKPAIICALVVIYSVTLRYSGFILNSLLLLNITMRLLKANMKIGIVISFITVIVIFVLFKIVLRVPLPIGVFGG